MDKLLSPRNSIWEDGDESLEKHMTPESQRTLYHFVYIHPDVFKMYPSSGNV